MNFAKFDRDSLVKQLINPVSNKKILGICTYVTLSAVSFIMTVMNIFTHKGSLTWATAIFAVLCLINLIVTLRGGVKGVTVASAIFAVELFALFTFFLISGNPEGFSAIWICMVPPIGMLFYDLGRGSIFCGAMFLELVWLLWTPWGRGLLRFEYTSSFKMRFPMLFIAFYFLAFLLQFLRFITQDELQRISKIHEEQALHDPLTGLYNREGIYSVMKAKLNERHESIGAVIFDIDFFKQVNDEHGHLAGDAVLQGFATILSSSLHAEIARWGGEEFAAFFYDGAVTVCNLEKILKQVESTTFHWEDVNMNVTVSAGIYEGVYRSDYLIKDLIKNADTALYEAKHTGRNRVVRYIGQ